MHEYVWRVLEHEGGFSDRKSDRGGKTFRGITWKTYVSWCERTGIDPSQKHHKNLEEEEVLALYVALFVKPYNIESYRSDWIKEAMFSTSIMHGGVAAAIMAQRVINDIASTKLKVDGIPGRMTQAAVNIVPSVIFVNSLSIKRVIFVDRLVQRTVGKGDPSQVDNLVGWHNRFLRFIQPKDLTHAKETYTDSDAASPSLVQPDSARGDH